MGYDVAVMAVFTIIALGDNTEALDARIPAAFPNEHLFLAKGRWLVVGDGIAKDISEKVGTSTTVGLFTVFAISGYFGWAPNTVWEWLALKSLTVKHG
jgi:hypothetical protein